MWRDSISIYFSSLRQAAISAVDPTSQAAPSIYDAANGHETVTSQHSDLPLCQGMSVRPSGLFPSVRNKPTGSLVTGTPAEAKKHAIKSFSVWCLAVLPRALLQTKLCSPRASTNEPQRHWCGWQRSIPSLRPTATRTVSSSNLSPQEAMGTANSQSPLCWEEGAKKHVRWYVDVRLASTRAFFSSRPGRSQNGLLVGKVSGTSPNSVDQWPFRQIRL